MTHPFNLLLPLPSTDEFNKSVELSCSGSTDSVNSNNSKKTRLYADATMHGRNPHEEPTTMMRGGEDQVCGETHTMTTMTDPCH